MKFRARYAVSVALGLLTFVDAASPPRIGEHFWPTPNKAFVEGRPLVHFVQPTASGNVTSALWGCVRNNGSRFHEGIDLKSIVKDRQGEATDPVFAFDNGVVRYVNRDASKSSYGRYVVVEHPQWVPGMVTLYGHLRAIPAAIRPGVDVKGGQRIATMGRSASYSIPRSRAHLHFEVGQWLGDEFQLWYDRQRFDDPNDHGSYNGMNIIGIDVWTLLQALQKGEYANVRDYLAGVPAAVSVTVWDSQIPDLLQVNPNLMVNYTIPEKHAGWRIDFSADGLPLRFEALAGNPRPGPKGVTVRVLNEKLARSQSCLSLVGAGKSAAPSPRLNSLLQRLFVD